MCNPQMQSFDVLTLLEMNEILELGGLEGAFIRQADGRPSAAESPS
jgi:hypothetical protein